MKPSQNTLNSSATGHSDAFSFARMQAVMYRFFMMNIWKWLVGLAIFAGAPLLLFLFISVISTFPANVETDFSGWMQLYVLAGLLLSSHLFTELHKTSTSWQLHLLPASSAEKFTAAWLISGPVFTIAAMLLISLITLILHGVVLVADGSRISIFNPLTDPNTGYLKAYFVLNSFFLAGSIRFNKMPFFSSLLLLILINLVLVMLSIFILRATGLNVSSFFIDPSIDIGFTGVFLKVLGYLFWIFLTGFLLTYGHHLLKTKEASS